MEEKSLGRSFLILSLAGIFVKILSAVYMPLLTLIIGREGYGVYSTSYYAFIFILAVTSMGAQPAITKVVSELRAQGHYDDGYLAMKIARNYLAIFGIIFTLIFVLFGDIIAAGMNSASSALSLKFLAPTILLSAVLAAYRGYMQGVGTMKELAISQVIEQFVNVVLSLVFAYLLIHLGIEWGSAGGTVGTTIGALVALIFIIFFFEKTNMREEAMERETLVKSIGKKRIIKKLIQYGLPITLVAAVQNSAGLIDAINVKWRLASAGFDGSQINVLFGTLNYYNTLIYVPLTIVTALCMAIFPRVIEAYVQKNRKELRSQIAYSYRMTFLITIPCSVGLALLSKEIFIFLLNDSYGCELLMYGSIVLVFMALTSIQNTILQGVNKLYLVIGTALLGIILKFTINFILVGIPSINIFGAIVGSIVAFVIPAIINHKKLQRVFKVRIPVFNQAVTPLVGSLFMALAVYLAKIFLLRIVNIFEGGRIAMGLVTIVAIAVGGICYFVVMILLRGITKKDLDMFSSRIYEVLPRFLRKKMK